MGSSIGSVMSSSIGSSSNRTEHIRDKQILNQHNITRYSREIKEFNTKLNDDTMRTPFSPDQAQVVVVNGVRDYLHDESVKYALRQPTKPQSSVVAGMRDNPVLLEFYQGLIKSNGDNQKFFTLLGLFSTNGEDDNGNHKQTPLMNFTTKILQHDMMHDRKLINATIRYLTKYKHVETLKKFKAAVKNAEPQVVDLPRPSTPQGSSQANAPSPGGEHLRHKRTSSTNASHAPTLSSRGRSLPDQPFVDLYQAELLQLKAREEDGTVGDVDDWTYQMETRLKAMAKTVLMFNGKEADLYQTLCAEFIDEARYNPNHAECLTLLLRLIHPHDYKAFQEDRNAEAIRHTVQGVLMHDSGKRFKQIHGIIKRELSHARNTGNKEDIQKFNDLEFAFATALPVTYSNCEYRLKYIKEVGHHQFRRNKTTSKMNPQMGSIPKKRELDSLLQTIKEKIEGKGRTLPNIVINLLRGLEKEFYSLLHTDESRKNLNLIFWGIVSADGTPPHSHEGEEVSRHKVFTKYDNPYRKYINNDTALRLVRYFEHNFLNGYTVNLPSMDAALDKEKRLYSACETTKIQDARDKAIEASKETEANKK